MDTKKYMLQRHILKKLMDESEDELDKVLKDIVSIEETNRNLVRCKDKIEAVLIGNIAALIDCGEIDKIEDEIQEFKNSLSVLPEWVDCFICKLDEIQQSLRKSIASIEQNNSENETDIVYIIWGIYLDCKYGDKENIYDKYEICLIYAYKAYAVTAQMFDKDRVQIQLDIKKLTKNGKKNKSKQDKIVANGNNEIKISVSKKAKAALGKVLKIASNRGIKYIQNKMKISQLEHKKEIIEYRLTELYIKLHNVENEYRKDIYKSFDNVNDYILEQEQRFKRLEDLLDED